MPLFLLDKWIVEFLRHIIEYIYLLKIFQRSKFFTTTSKAWVPVVMHALQILVSVQFSSVVQSCPTLCDPMDCSKEGFPVHHKLPELAQTHVHWVSDAIQACHPLSSPFPPVFNLSQHQGLSQWVSSSHQVAKVLELQLQHQSFQWTFRVDFLYDWSLLISLLSKGLSRAFSNTTVQKHQFLGTQLSLWSNPHIHTVLLEKI